MMTGPCTDSARLESVLSRPVPPDPVPRGSHVAASGPMSADNARAGGPHGLQAVEEGAHAPLQDRQGRDGAFTVAAGKAESWGLADVEPAMLVSKTGTGESPYDLAASRKR